MRKIYAIPPEEMKKLFPGCCNRFATIVALDKEEKTMAYAGIDGHLNDEEDVKYYIDRLISSSGAPWDCISSKKAIAVRDKCLSGVFNKYIVYPRIIMGQLELF